MVWLDIWRNKINDENISIGLKCGINTGYDLVGYIPTKERDEFTAVGSNVNLASRLEKKGYRQSDNCIIKYKRKNSV